MSDLRSKCARGANLSVRNSGKIWGFLVLKYFCLLYCAMRQCLFSLKCARVPERCRSICGVACVLMISISYVGLLLTHNWNLWLFFEHHAQMVCLHDTCSTLWYNSTRDEGTLLWSRSRIDISLLWVHHQSTLLDWTDHLGICSSTHPAFSFSHGPACGCPMCNATISKKYLLWRIVLAQFRWCFVTNRSTYCYIRQAFNRPLTGSGLCTCPWLEDKLSSRPGYTRRVYCQKKPDVQPGVFTPLSTRKNLRVWYGPAGQPDRIFLLTQDHLWKCSGLRCKQNSLWTRFCACETISSFVSYVGLWMYPTRQQDKKRFLNM